MANRPSLLDDADLASVGTGKAAKSRSGPGMDGGKVAKIAVAIVFFALAIVAGTYSMWKPEGVVKNSRGEVVKPAVLTPEDEEAFQRQERQRELFLEQGGQEGSE